MLRVFSIKWFKQQEYQSCLRVVSQHLSVSLKYGIRVHGVSQLALRFSISQFVAESSFEENVLAVRLATTAVSHGLYYWV